MALGFEAIGATPFYEISAEAAPTGKSELVLVTDAPKSVKFAGMHSITYDSDQVITDLVRRIREQQSK